jgi:hypothetical protein
MNAVPVGLLEQLLPYHGPLQNAEAHLQHLHSEPGAVVGKSSLDNFNHFANDVPVLN